MSQHSRSNRRRTRKSFTVRIVEFVIIALVLVAAYFAVDFVFKQWDAEMASHDAAVQYFKVNGHMPSGYEE